MADKLLVFGLFLSLKFSKYPDDGPSFTAIIKDKITFKRLKEYMAIFNMENPKKSKKTTPAIIGEEKSTNTVRITKKILFERILKKKEKSYRGKIK